MTVATLSFEVLQEFEGGGRQVRFVSGPLAGRVVVMCPAADDESSISTTNESDSPDTVASTLSPSQKARLLLLSLLTPAQRADWISHHRIVLCTAYGRVEFGRLSDIGYWPHGDGEFRLCVLPAGPDDFPEDDVWTNLLLALLADPCWFLTVANWRRPGSDWCLGPAPGLVKRSR